jgi:hypothetical protein
MSSLFGHLAPKFASNPEDVATDALSYVLRSSQSARKRFIEHINVVAGTSFSEELRFSTRETNSGGGIPDLRGTAQGQRLLVEVKFWAGLTTRQSEGYGDTFSEDRTGACVFLVPEQRVEHVFRSLGESLDEEISEFSSASLELTSGEAIAVSSWSTVLSKIESAVQESHEEGRHRVLNDIRQLRGLCQRLNAQAFHPVRKEEVGPEVAKRHLDFKDLVEDVKKIVQGGRFSGWTNTGRASSSYHSHRFNGNLHGIEYFFGVMYKQWKKFEASPFWMKFREDDPHRRKKIKNVLRTEVEVFDHPSVDKDVLIPINTKLNADRAQVISHFEEQMDNISNKLSASFSSES